MNKNLKNRTRFEEDRNRTINDFYRMNLDETAENGQMKMAYHTYLGNTPGSKRALEELLITKNSQFDTSSHKQSIVSQA